jgi:hypothetical protein
MEKYKVLTGLNEKFKKQIKYLFDFGFEVGMPSLQLYAGVSRFETISPAFKSGQSWRLKNFPLGPLFGFQANDEKFLKIILWYPL